MLGETPSGNLLIGTGHGLSVLEQKDGKVINFNSKTGFPLTLVNRKSMHVSRNHDIYMGGATGLVAIRESSLSYPPKYTIWSWRICMSITKRLPQAIKPAS